MTQPAPSQSDELIDQLCDMIRAQHVPELVSEPIMPWEQRSNPTDASISGKRPSRGSTSSWNLMYAAAFACLVLLVSSFFYGSLGNPTAFAQVQSAVAKTKSVRFRVLDYHGDQDPLITSVIVLFGVGARSEGPDGSESILNRKQQNSIYVNHRAKTAQVMQMYIDKDSPSFMEQHLSNIISIASSNVKALEPSTLDGKKVARYEFHDSGRFVVSVDPDSHLPVRMEMELPNGLPGGKRFREVCTDFVFDSNIEESLFAIHPPEGYKIDETKTPSDRKPIDTSTLVVGPVTGIGQVVWSDSKDDVIAKLGQPDFMEERKALGIFDSPVAVAPDQDGNRIAPDAAATKPATPASTSTFELRYPSLGFDLSVDPEGLRSIRCYGRKRMGDFAIDFAGRTENDFRLGSSIEDVLAKLGKPEVRTTGREEKLFYPHRGYDFLFADTKLVEFTVTKPRDENIVIQDNGDGTWSEAIRSKD